MEETEIVRNAILALANFRVVRIDTPILAQYTNLDNDEVESALESLKQFDMIERNERGDVIRCGERDVQVREEKVQHGNN